MSKSRKPRLVNNYSRPLMALVDTLNCHVGERIGYSYLRDEWYHNLGNRDERFAEWFDYAFELELFKAAAHRTFFEEGRNYTNIHVLRDIIITPWDKLD